MKSISLSTKFAYKAPHDRRIDLVMHTLHIRQRLINVVVQQVVRDANANIIIIQDQIFVTYIVEEG